MKSRTTAKKACETNSAVARISQRGNDTCLTGRQPSMLHAGNRVTPESKAQSVLRLELSRQRGVASRMRDADREVTGILDILGELLRDHAFVALLRARGHTSIPRTLREQLGR